jgi:transposase
VNFLNLKNWEVRAIKESPNDYRVEATYEDQPGYCPRCHRMFAKLYRHGTREQLLMDLPSHGKRVGIVLTRFRYRCQECGQTFLQPLPDVDDHSQMTRRLVRYIEEQSVRRTFTSVAGDVGVDEKTVRNLFRAYVAGLDQKTIFETPDRMGIDEVHLLRKPRCVLTNLTQRTIFGVLPDRNKKTVIAHLKSLGKPETVRVVTMDMWRPYYDACKDVFPAAALIVDKFHVVRMANQSLEQIRKTLRAGLESKARRRLMHDRFVLLRRARDLDDKQRAVLAGWSQAFPLLATAYALKEAFYAIWDVPTKPAAIAAYDAWEKSVAGRELITAYRPLLTAMHNWREPIFAYWDHRATNALTEALNGIAKAVERAGRGYSFDAIRAKMLYSKVLQKQARRPKYGEESVGRSLESPDDATIWGTDLDALLRVLETEAGRLDGSTEMTN